MPVIVNADNYENWLDPANDEERLKELLKHPYVPDLTFWPIGTAVNSPANDYPEIINSI